MPPAEALSARTVRCAIYIRKSTEEGLSQEFNSLDAQRECAEAYILSQRPQGWTALPAHYDDAVRPGRLCGHLQGGLAEPLAVRHCPHHADLGEARGELRVRDAAAQ